jgi:acyl transferase domain-containing protein
MGVFVGISTPDYGELARRHSEISAYSATGSALSVAAGRISYLWGFKGPSISVDTACSSSLVGTHMARLSMLQGGCSAAATAGVKLILTPETSAMFNRAGMLTADGRCKTLDAAADGYVRGEAVASLVLQLASQSSTVGQAICLVQGSAVNQDGKSSALTAPNGPAQQVVLRQALLSAGTAASSLQMVQMHGTGTPLGDPIEVGALAAVATRGGSPVTLTAGKTGIGHTEPAAGVVGMLHAAKSVFSSHSQPIFHLHKLNAYMLGSVSGTNTGLFAAPKQHGAFGASPSGLAGVSSFAFQGTNAHILLGSPTGVLDLEEAGMFKAPAWKKQFINVVPPAHPLIGLAIPSGTAVAFEFSLGAPVAAFFNDHQVSGKPIFPGQLKIPFLGFLLKMHGIFFSFCFLYLCS